MTRPFLLAAALLALAACGDDPDAALPPPVTMTTEALGHYCQMYVVEHPGPKAQVHLGERPHPLFFSQVRDAIAYQRMPEQSHSIVAIYVNDMATAPSWEEPGVDNWILADRAYFVVDAEIVGGMGAPELVPFSDRAAAEAFAARHGGRIQQLAEIADGAVLAPVVFEGDIGAEDDGDFEDRLRGLSEQGGHGHAGH